MGEELSFSDVVRRLVAAGEQHTTAKVIGIYHLYRHVAVSESESAVKSGLQHLSFQPMLVRLPSRVPKTLACIWNHVEDDEFVWRVVMQYGEDAVLKLRYIVGSFDVGKMSGGLQSAGLSAAMEKQKREGEEIMLQHCDAFEWVKTSSGGSRTADTRVRLRADITQGHNIPGAAEAIEEAANKRQARE